MLTMLPYIYHKGNVTLALDENPSHHGFDFVRTILDNFEIAGPDGNTSPWKSQGGPFKEDCQTTKSHRRCLSRIWKYLYKLWVISILSVISSTQASIMFLQVPYANKPYRSQKGQHLSRLWGFIRAWRICWSAYLAPNGERNQRRPSHLFVTQWYWRYGRYPCDHRLLSC